MEPQICDLSQIDDKYITYIVKKYVGVPWLRTSDLICFYRSYRKKYGTTSLKRETRTILV